MSELQAMKSAESLSLGNKLAPLFTGGFYRPLRRLETANEDGQFRDLNQRASGSAQQLSC